MGTPSSRMPIPRTPNPPRAPLPRMESRTSSPPNRLPAITPGTVRSASVSETWLVRASVVVSITVTDTGSLRSSRASRVAVVTTGFRARARAAESAAAFCDVELCAAAWSATVARATSAAPHAPRERDARTTPRAKGSGNDMVVCCERVIGASAPPHERRSARCHARHAQWRPCPRSAKRIRRVEA